MDPDGAHRESLAPRPTSNAGATWTPTAEVTARGRRRFPGRRFLLPSVTIAGLRNIDRRRSTSRAMERPTARASRSSNRLSPVLPRSSTPTACRVPGPGDRRRRLPHAPRQEPAAARGSGRVAARTIIESCRRRRKEERREDPPDDDVLEEFVLSLDDRDRSLLRHLGLCPYCRSRLHYLPRPLVQTRPGTLNPPRDAESRPLSPSGKRPGRRNGRRPRPLCGASGATRRRAGPPSARSPRFQTWGVFELLVERSLEACIQDPAFGEHLGLLALRLSDHLDRGRYGAERISDLRARTWAFVGNTCRTPVRLPGGEEACSGVPTTQEGNGDGLERAIFLDLKASLRRDQRRFDESLRLLRRAVELFLGHGEQHRAGRSW